MAAAEYENITNDYEDYLSSVQRYFQRTSIVSSLKPIGLFIKVDPIIAEVNDPNLKIKEIA